MNRYVNIPIRRLIILTVILVLVLTLFYVLRSVLFPFGLGLVLAYILMPIISRLERKLPRKWKSTRREIAILLIFLVILVLFSAFLFYIVFTLLPSLTGVVNNAPEYTTTALHRINDMITFVRNLLPAEAHPQIDTFLNEAGTAMGNAVKSTFLNGILWVPNNLGLIIGLAALPVFLFYILRDWTKMRADLYSGPSAGVTAHIRNLFSIIGKIIGRYIRAQLLLGLVVGSLALAGLLILGIPFAPVLALIAGLTELIPLLGPWIGGITMVMVALATAPEKALWVAILALVVQLLENIFLVPRIQGGQLRVHPAAAIVLLVVGTYVAGFWGLVLSVPLAAVLVEIYKYVYHGGPPDLPAPNQLKKIPGQPESSID